MISRRIRKVAVLGSGLMGSGIACHLAGVGLDVMILDIVPFDLTEDQKKNPKERNRIVNSALDTAIKSKPAELELDRCRAVVLRPVDLPKLFASACI